jgi:ABC-2 type transport system ATP-binding protein
MISRCGLGSRERRWARGRKRVLHDVDLDVGPGVNVLLGPNGAGKSTLFAALVGLLPVQSGTLGFVADDGSPVDRKTARRSLGYMPQEGSVPRGVALERIVGYAAWLHRVPSAERHDAVAEALRATRLTEQAGTPAQHLSGGMKRRAQLACALVHRPALMVLDEPAVGLDPAEQHAFRELLREQAVERTVLLSTHILDEAAAVADVLLVLVEGTIRFAGPAADLVRGAGEAGTRELERAYLELASPAAQPV